MRRCAEKEKATLMTLIMTLCIVCALGLYLAIFTSHNPMNILFMVQFISFSLSYFMCRRLDVTPYVDSERPQYYLKISALLLQFGVVTFVICLKYLQISDALFIFSLFPLAEQAVDMLKQSNSGKSELIRASQDDSTLLHGTQYTTDRKTAFFSFITFFGIIVYWLSTDNGFAGAR